MRYELTRYVGADEIPSYEGKRYALQVGPILLGCVGPWTDPKSSAMVLPLSPLQNATDWLVPTDTPLHFGIKGAANYTFMPLWDVEEGEAFTTYPVFQL